LLSSIWRFLVKALSDTLPVPEWGGTFKALTTLSFFAESIFAVLAFSLLIAHLGCLWFRKKFAHQNRGAEQ